MAARGLVPTEVTELREILGRRDPDAARAIADAGALLDDGQRERIRRAVVDELCDLPAGDGRRAMELQELLTHLEQERA